MTNTKIDNPNCERFELLIHQRIDGEISSAERDELQLHLSNCTLCRARDGQIDRINEYIIASTTLTESASAFDGGDVDESLTAAGMNTPSVTPSPGARFRRPLTAVFSSLAVIVAIIMVASPRANSSPSNRQLEHPMVLLQEINSERRRDQERMRQSMELDLRSLKLQLVAMDESNAREMGERIERLMNRVKESTQTAF